MDDMSRRSAMAPMTLAMLPVCPLAGSVFSLPLPDGMWRMASASVISAMLLILATFSAGRIARVDLTGGPPAALGLLTGIACTVCAYPAAMLVSEVMSRCLPSGAAGLVPVMQAPPWLAWALLALLPAIAEEMLFRGLLYGSFRRHGFLFAAVLSAVCFSCVHGSLQQAAYTLLLGLVWAALRECTGSVWPCVIGHLFFNTAGLVSAYQARPLPLTSGEVPALWPLACFAFAGLFGCGAVMRAAGLRLHDGDPAESGCHGALTSAFLAVLAASANIIANMILFSA